MSPSIGRIVLYHFTNAQGRAVARPAIVVQAWDPKGPESLVNLQVFLDGPNDHAAGTAASEPPPATMWVGSVHGHQGEAPPENLTAWWSWPPRV